MPSNRKRRTRSRKSSIDDWRTERLKTGVLNYEGGNTFARISFDNYTAKLDVWKKCKEKVLLEWLEENPGTRPYAWWLFDAPEMHEDDEQKLELKSLIYPCGPRVIDPRKKIGGIGTPDYEVLNCGQSLYFGVPISFVDQWQCDYYNGREKDIDGNQIGTEYKEGDFVAEAYDPHDPPVYETEVAYLKRHGLLTTEEKKKLKSGAIS